MDIGAVYLLVGFVVCLYFELFNKSYGSNDPVIMGNLFLIFIWPISLVVLLAHFMYCFLKTKR